MMFERYQHVEKFETEETAGIETGTCYVFPKLDGTNGSIWLNEYGQIRAGSRNRELSMSQDNSGFYEWALKQDNIIKCLSDNPGLRLFGEWLVPHTIKTYRDEAWNKFYVFDVMIKDEYMPYEVYITILSKYYIDYIPALCKINNPTKDKLVEMLDKSTYLVKDGFGSGEGIVIKNYDYKNRFGRIAWAKIVKNEFKDMHYKNGMFGVAEIKCKSEVEDKIVEKYVTEALIDKEYSKIKLESGGWQSKYIPRLLNTVFYCLVKEESWNMVKDFKNPTIDYRRLNTLTVQRIKSLRPEMF